MTQEAIKAQMDAKLRERTGTIDTHGDERDCCRFELEPE
jgi:hypothetical protein